jgi:hypothetical protein
VADLVTNLARGPHIIVTKLSNFLFHLQHSILGLQRHILAFDASVQPESVEMGLNDKIQAPFFGVGPDERPDRLEER